MNKFIRAIGFSKYETRKQYSELVQKAKQEAKKVVSMPIGNKEYATEYMWDIAEKTGIIVHTTVAGADEYFEYMVPYFRGSIRQCEAPVSVDHRVDEDSWLAACDDDETGINFVFRVTNYVDCSNFFERLNSERMKNFPFSVYLSALSTEAKVILPIERNQNSHAKRESERKRRQRMQEAANTGDMETYEMLSFRQLDELTSAYNRTEKEDILSIVDSNFMPEGLECDRYAIMGDIVGIRKTENPLTKEMFYQLDVEFFDKRIEVCINEADLFGEPQIGRRLKGSIWLQGHIELPSLFRRRESNGKTEVSD
ncbi:MAG: DUF3881 family protein [Lachnospiraceae bacterium]|nr:DUF3881 family protein [Lachnospiraceae bacterium]